MGAQDPAPEPQARLQIGRYQVVHPLGQGAMGEVLLAYDPVLDRNVALKYLRRDLDLLPAQRDSLVQRLWQEARASARLAHPNIVALYDMGQDDTIGPYLVFEYVEGPTLKERLRRGPLEATAAARLARELGEALATAHGASVLHRDVKPENVIMRRFGAKIADFGIARLPNSTLTRRGSLLGTPAYSAPETLEGAQFSPLSDQFSLASTLYEAISGQRAFPGNDALQVASKVRLDEPRPIAAELGLDPDVDQALMRGLSKKPSQRFPDCAALGVALAEAIAKTAGADALPVISRAQDTMSAMSVPVPPTRIGLAPALLGGALALLGTYFILVPEQVEQKAALAASQVSAPLLSAPSATSAMPGETSRTSWVAPKASAKSVAKHNATQPTRLKVAKAASSQQAKTHNAAPRSKYKTPTKSGFIGTKAPR